MPCPRVIYTHNYGSRLHGFSVPGTSARGRGWRARSSAVDTSRSSTFPRTVISPDRCRGNMWAVSTAHLLINAKARLRFSSAAIILLLYYTAIVPPDIGEDRLSDGTASVVVVGHLGDRTYYWRTT